MQSVKMESEILASILGFICTWGAMTFLRDKNSLNSKNLESNVKRIKTILICFGTRPEYIKVKSLIDNLESSTDDVCKVKTCFTGQHKDLLHNIGGVDYKLEMQGDHLMEISQNRLNNIMCNIMKYSHIFQNVKYVLVQGDTTTALAMAISAYNHGLLVVHLEAGLRSYDDQNPFPEEMNRRLISKIAEVHLCPTVNNMNNLLKENIDRGRCHVVGNTGLDNIRTSAAWERTEEMGDTYGNQVLLTMHRRENLNQMSEWFACFEEIAQIYSDIEFLIPLHPNPLVQKHKHLLKRVKTCAPLTHVQTISYLRQCRFVISDSGGLQEECSFLKKKVLVCRKTTERPETLGSTSFLVHEPSDLMPMVHDVMQNCRVPTDVRCPYGDGRSWVKTKQVLESM